MVISLEPTVNLASGCCAGDINNSAGAMSVVARTFQLNQTVECGGAIPFGAISLNRYVSGLIRLELLWEVSAQTRAVCDRFCSDLSL